MVGRSVWLVLGRQSDAAAVALSAVGQTERNGTNCLSVRRKGTKGRTRTAVFTLRSSLASSASCLFLSLSPLEVRL